MNREHTVTEHEFKEIVERLTAGESSIKSAHHRIDKIEKIADSVSKMAISINNIAAETKALREDYIKADEKIENLREKPSKRLETFINSMLTALGGGIVGYLLSLIIN